MLSTFLRGAYFFFILRNYIFEEFIWENISNPISGDPDELLTIPDLSYQEADLENYIIGIPIG